MLRRFSYAALLFALASTMALASSRNPGKVIAGWIEKVTVLETGDIIKVKLDTGAETSAINARVLKTFKRGGKRMARFELILDADKPGETVLLERERERRVRIKEGDGEYDRRVVVKLGICFNGRRYQTDFTLADRSDYIYPAILGRSFLEKVAVVDPDETFQTQARCEDDD